MELFVTRLRIRELHGITDRGIPAVTAVKNGGNGERVLTFLTFTAVAVVMGTTI